MSRTILWPFLAGGILLLTAEMVAADNRPGSGAFFVIDRGTALLSLDGEEIERLDAITFAAGALSPDGNWVAFSQSGEAVPEVKREAKLVIQSRARPQERMAVPLIWGGTGSSFLPLWSADSKRLLICEQGWNGKVRESACRIYDLTNESMNELKLPKEWWPCDWSLDGKRLLTTPEGTGRVAWVRIDGTGEPEFITRETLVAHGARLSPDGKRILCMTALRRPEEDRRRFQLAVFDLETKNGTRVSEPGETDGYCWSPDGLRIAYTWQRSLAEPAEVPVRETFLKTCDFDGGNQKTITSRKYEVPRDNPGRSETVSFFKVLAWR